MPAAKITRRMLLHVLSLPAINPLPGCGGSLKPAAGWGDIEAIRGRIRLPRLTGPEHRITDFGAVDDGKTDSGPAIRRAIAQASLSGGGRVVVPAGAFATGPVHLDSGIEFHVAEGATLTFIADPALYLPPVFTRWEGIELMSYSPLIYAYGKSDVAVTGTGVIDGGASDTRWWPWKGPWKGKFEADPHTQAAARARLQEDGDNDVPPERRVYAAGAYLRPPCIQFYRCERVLIDGITIQNSPFWCLHPVLCRQVTVQGVSVDSHGPNSDGCNPESCEDVWIERCVFDTGDDCIAIKSGRNADGRRLNIPCRNVVISQCQMKDGHGGVVMGSELSGGIENVFVVGCRMDSPNLERGIRIKTNAVRGGFVRNVNVRNVDIGFVKELLVINFLYEEGPNGPFKPDVRDIVLEDVTCREATRVLNIQGLNTAHVRDVVLRRVDVGQVHAPSVVRNIDSLSLSEVEVAGCSIEHAAELM